ncbi:hypothetical protein Hanom_Chr01g00069821 [Helianthus anomalus]
MKTTYITLLSEKFGGVGRPSPPLLYFAHELMNKIRILNMQNANNLHDQKLEKKRSEQMVFFPVKGLQHTLDYHYQNKKNHYLQHSLR